MKYLVVERWEEFQHYKNRAPLWIKNYTRLLHDDVYLGLSGHRRAILHGLWLVYASSSCRLVFDHGSLGRRLNLRVTSADLQALRKAGFIAVSASKPLAPRKQDASLEQEVEIEKENKRPLVLGLDEEKIRELDRILGSVPGASKDSLPKLSPLVGGLPLGVAVDVRERAVSGGKGIGWVVNAMQGEIDKRRMA